MVAVLALALAVGAGWWAARATMDSSVDASEGTVEEMVWAEATQSSVGRSLPLSTTLRQPANVVAVNGLSGVVTEVSPGEVDVGSTVYAVAGTPVRVVAGDIPFYRDLEVGVSGPDVTQLRDGLVQLGYLDEAGDNFDEATGAAVEEWQEDLGIPQTGGVTWGEVIAIPSLPTVVQLGDSIQLARQIGGGEEAVLAPTGEQSFVLAVSQDQAGLIPAEATVEITWQQQTWSAVITGSVQDEWGGTEFDLAAPDGGPVCADACDTLPGDAQVILRSEVVITPRISGIAVPAAAVRSSGDGSVYVITDDGEVQVSVRGSGSGIAIVDGIEEGIRIQVLGGDGATAPLAPPPAPGGDSPAPDGDSVDGADPDEPDEDAPADDADNTTGP